MQQTKREILDDFLGFVIEQGDSIARDIAERALTRALLTVWLKAPWAQFRAPSPYEFATVAGTREYALPRQFGRMADRSGRIRNLTLGTWLDPIDRGELDERHPEAGTSLDVNGQPIGYLLDGTVGVSRQPDSAGEACEVVSSSGSDIAVEVYLEGLDANGVHTRAEFTLTGAVAVAVGTWSKIFEFGKAYDEATDPTTEDTSSAGTVTLRTVAGPVTLQTLSPDESAVDLPVLSLYRTPDAVYTIAVPYMRAPRRIRHDADPLPRFWGNAIFEDLQIQWHVNKGKYASDAQAPRPHLLDLLGLESANRAAVTKQRRPFGVA
jgi:hypothetical protein